MDLRNLENRDQEALVTLKESLNQVKVLLRASEEDNTNELTPMSRHPVPISGPLKGILSQASPRYRENVPKREPSPL